MIYIHSLKDLNAKTADIESVQLMRSLKCSVNPINEQQFKESLSRFFITDDEIVLMEDAAAKVDSAVSGIYALSQKNDPVHEKINMKRAVTMLSAMRNPLAATIEFSKKMKSQMDEIGSDFALIMNNLHKLNPEQKAGCNQRLKQIFSDVLRCDDMRFNSVGVVNEGEVEAAKSLHESMAKGFLFHFTIDDELKKRDFNAIKPRIPSAELEAVDELSAKIGEVKKGVDIAYKHNLNMAEMAVLLYTYTKCVMKG